MVVVISVVVIVRSLEKVCCVSALCFLPATFSCCFPIEEGYSPELLYLDGYLGWYGLLLIF